MILFFLGEFLWGVFGCDCFFVCRRERDFGPFDWVAHVRLLKKFGSVPWSAVGTTGHVNQVVKGGLNLVRGVLPCLC